MNFRDFLCEWLDECELFTDKKDPINEKIENKTVTQDL